MKQQVTKNVPALIALSLALVASLGMLLRWHDSSFLQGASSSDPFFYSNLAYLLMPIGATLLTLAAVVFAFVSFNRWVTLAAIAVSALLMVVVEPSIFISVFAQNVGAPDATLVRQVFIWNDYDGWGIADSTFKLLWTPAFVLAVVALFTNKKNLAPAAVDSAEQSFESQQPFAAPAISAPDNLPVSSLPLVALIVVFFSPIIGLILAYVAQNKINYRQVSSVNASQAKLALILGWVFFGLSVISGMIIGLLVAAYQMQHQGY